MSAALANLSDVLCLAVAAQVDAERKFEALIKRARRGEKNLELAAATAAGMSHAARKIANSIRAAIKDMEKT